MKSIKVELSGDALEQIEKIAQEEHRSLKNTCEYLILLALQIRSEVEK